MEQGLVKKNERTPEIVAAEIRTFTASMLNSVIEIGRRLCEAKEMLPHGQFVKWIEENTGYGKSTAYNFMKLYMEYGDQQGNLFGAVSNFQTFGNLTYSKALALLAVPAEEREEFVKENNVEDMSARELQDAIRERDAARLEAQAARADAEAAEESRQIMQRELDLQRNQKAMAEERAEEAEHKLLGANDAIDKAEAEAAALRKEVKELKSRPIDVAIQPQRDEAAIEEARQEVRAEMQSALDEANAALDEANAAAQKAAESEGKLRKELDAMRKAAERNAKNVAPENAQAVSDFTSYYNQTQELVNKMNGILLKLVQKDPEMAGKLGNALIALSDAIKEEIKKEAAV